MEGDSDRINTVDRGGTGRLVSGTDCRVTAENRDFEWRRDQLIAFCCARHLELRFCICEI